jgi:ABC-type branched-subunit amino acid transport system substrate-binding protein
MTRRRKRSRGVATATAAAGALVVSACGGSGSSANSATSDTSSPGVSSSTITLGTTQPLTGPAAPGYSKISAAMSAYFDYVNANGGVNGRKIKLLVEDDGYNPTITATKTRELVLQDKVFAMVGALGTPTHTAVLDFLKQNKVPDLFVASGSRSWNQPDKYPTTFGWQPDYTVEGKILGDYIKKNFPGKTVCSFGQGDDFGTDGAEGVELTLGQGSLKSKQTYTPTNTNVGPQIGALKAAGCEVVTAFTVPGFTALALGTAAKLKYAPQWVISNVGSDIYTLRGFLKDATDPLLEGAISDYYLPLPNDTKNSWIKLFQKIDASYDDHAPFDGNVEYGMALAYTTVQALEAAGDDPTRGSLLAAVEKGGFTGPGLTPFRFSASDHSGFGGTQVVKIHNGVPVAVGPVYTTDDGSGPLQKVTTTPPEAPADGLPQ